MAKINSSNLKISVSELVRDSSESRLTLSDDLVQQIELAVSDLLVSVTDNPVVIEVKVE